MRERHRREVRSKRHDLAPGVQNNPATKARLRQIGQGAETPKIPTRHCRTGFDFQPYDVACRIFQHHIYFLSRLRAKMK